MAASNKESTKNILFVALVLCLACSIIVSSASVLLRPIQEKNALLDKKKNILLAAGIFESDNNIEEVFSRIKPRLVDFETGEFSDAYDPLIYSVASAMKDPSLREALEPSQDIANIKAMPPYGELYLYFENDELKKVIFPIQGPGLWGQMFGYVALDGETLTEVQGLAYYQHIETPGLGGEVDNPRWKKQWIGKDFYNEQGEVIAKVGKGSVDPNRPEAAYTVDGLSGATITSNSVTKHLRFWGSEIAYGKVFEKLRQQYLGMR